MAICQCHVQSEMMTAPNAASASMVHGFRLFSSVAGVYAWGSLPCAAVRSTFMACWTISGSRGVSIVWCWCQAVRAHK